MSINGLWDLFDFHLVDWSAIPQQTMRWIGLCVVVGFSSTLDVAAIEMELGKPLNYDKELSMIGISNMVSGLTGGYSGSYIFSQTIFNLRRGVNSRICGFIIAFMELVVVIVPYSITGYTPKFFYGSLLVLIAVDLMLDWLIYSYHRMKYLELLICWCTFFSIQLFGIEIGMVIGIAASLLEFTYSYSIRYQKQLMSNLYESKINSSLHRLASSSLQQQHGSNQQNE